MSLTIENADVERLARELAAETGQDLNNAVALALQRQLAAVKAQRLQVAAAKSRVKSREGLAERLMEIGRRSAAKCVHDDRTADEILGYDEHGLPS